MAKLFLHFLYVCGILPSDAEHVDNVSYSLAQYLVIQQQYVLTSLLVQATDL